MSTLESNKRIAAIAILACLLVLLSGCARLGIYRLALEAEPSSGPAPLIVTFKGEIKGGPSYSPELHCQVETWDFGEGELMSVFGLCMAWKPGTRIERHFEQYHTYTESGLFTVTFSYGPLKSDPVTIEVLE